MKKPHKSKPHKAGHKHRPAPMAHASSPNANRLLPNNTRRSGPPQQHPRRPQPARYEPAGLYRPANPLALGSADDRRLFRLLLTPFVVLALMMLIVPALQVHPTLRDLIVATPQIPVAQLPLEFAPLAETAATLAPARLPAQLPTRVAELQPPVAAKFSPATEASPARVPVAASTATVTAVAAAPTPPPLAWLPIERDAMPRPASPADVVALATPAFGSASSVNADMPQLNALLPEPELTPSPAGTVVAMLTSPDNGALLRPVPVAPLETSCPVAYGSAAPPPAEPAAFVATSPIAFGRSLATAAAAQTSRFVIYDDKYRQIARSGGDVPPLFGVCTDVIIRAYRALGVDLQTLVQAAKVGAGDPNIDHRRTETLRRFLARYGQSLPVTDFSENYQPGDIVTYWRPQNSGSRSHIALVSDRLGPSGRPMIIHNRGWGPQFEDALFVDRITGHYRYDGSVRPAVPVLATSPAPSALRPSATPINLAKPVPAESDGSEAKPTGL